MMAGPAVAGTNSTTLANGADLSVTVSNPTTGDTFLVPTGSTTVDVPIGGSASIGQGEPNVHWTYVVDVSGSTGSGCGAAGGTVLDCEKDAVTNLNTEIATDGSGLDVGLAIFGSTGASADMKADGGDQLLTTPADPGVGTVINSIVVGGMSQFTPRSVGSATSFPAGMAAALNSVAASSAASKNVVFLSDGFSGTGTLANFNARLAALDAAGATIYSFAVGSGSSCTGGSVGTLQAMADATGGTCTNVPDPATLPDIVKNVTDTEMTGVGLEVDTASTSFDTITVAPPFDGPGSTDFTATAADQAPGSHKVCASATGTGPKSDSTSEKTVTQCETYDVYAFALTPETATNELGTDNEHTVTATVQGPAGKLAGWPVAFAVTGQNAGETGTCAPASCKTDTNGEVTFTYSVPVEPDSLGTDTISATVTVNSESATVDVTKEWVDTTAPTATCEPGPNPAGKIPAAPGNGGQGQNQDGFYTVTATDDVWGAESLEVYVTDHGTSYVFGPYENPTNIKWTEANGAEPSEKAGSGAVDWALKGQGDAKVTAVDGSRNTSDPVACLVPPAPQ